MSKFRLKTDWINLKAGEIVEPPLHDVTYHGLIPDIEEHHMLAAPEIFERLADDPVNDLASNDSGNLTERDQSAPKPPNLSNKDRKE